MLHLDMPRRYLLLGTPYFFKSHFTNHDCFRPTMTKSSKHRPAKFSHVCPFYWPLASGSPSSQSMAKSTFLDSTDSAGLPRFACRAIGLPTVFGARPSTVCITYHFSIDECTLLAVTEMCLGTECNLWWPSFRSCPLFDRPEHAAPPFLPEDLRINTWRWLDLIQICEPRLRPRPSEKEKLKLVKGNTDRLGEDVLLGTVLLRRMGTVVLLRLSTDHCKSASRVESTMPTASTSYAVDRCACGCPEQLYFVNRKSTWESLEFRLQSPSG